MSGVEKIGEKSVGSTESHPNEDHNQGVSLSKTSEEAGDDIDCVQTVTRDNLLTKADTRSPLLSAMLDKDKDDPHAPGFELSKLSFDSDKNLLLCQESHTQAVQRNDAIEQAAQNQSTPSASFQGETRIPSVVDVVAKPLTLDASPATIGVCVKPGNEKTELIISPSKEVTIKCLILDNACLTGARTDILSEMNVPEEKPKPEKASNEISTSAACIKDVEKRDPMDVDDEISVKDEQSRTAQEEGIQSGRISSENKTDDQKMDLDSLPVEGESIHRSGHETSPGTSTLPCTTLPDSTDVKKTDGAAKPLSDAEDEITCITLDSPASVVEVPVEGADASVRATISPKDPRKSPNKKKGSASVAQKASKKSAPCDSDDYVPDGFGQKKDKRLKKRKVRDANAPTPPLSGYIRFLNSRRDNLRAQNPSMAFSVIIKTLAQEWSRLSAEEKKPWLQEADEDRQRFMKEMAEYKKTDTYKDFMREQQKQRQKELQEERKAAAAAAKQKQRKEKEMKNQKKHGGPTVDGLDIPVFTEEFLDHNKACEAELRQLRRLSTDCEQQNASLSHIVNSMRSAVTSLEEETAFKRANNQRLQNHLDKIRSALATAFKDIPLPGTGDGPTADTIDEYMAKMHSHVSGPESEENKVLFEQISGIIDRLDFG